MIRSPQAQFRSRPTRGFTIIELTIVVAIIALLVGSMLIPLSTQMQVKRIKETERYLEDAKEALLGFAAANGFLPCPDAVASRDGVADGCGAGPQVFGFLPWQTLGIPPTDAWGNLIRYGVTVEFAVQRNPALPCAGGDGTLGICDVGNFTVFTRGDDPTTAGAVETKSIVNLTGFAPLPLPPLPLPPGAPVVLVSHGSNGLGSTNLRSGLPAPQPPLGTDELINASNFPNFVNRRVLPQTTGCNDNAGSAGPLCTFDDIVTWIPTGILLNRMLVAGTLP